MPKSRTVHLCSSCGAKHPQWAGRCPTCLEWNCLEEVSEAPPTKHRVQDHDISAVAITDIEANRAETRPTGIGELDRVLGGGLVPGSVTLVGGEPGIGKSTLVLQSLASMASFGARCLLVSAEESAHQVKLRACRLGADTEGLWLLAETHMRGVRSAVETLSPDVLVVDSIQTVWDEELDSTPGSVTQVRGCAQSLVQLAKSSGIAVLLVGHVTKDGTLAGPRVLEHVVDTVLTFEGERYHALRLLRAVKHRFGSTGELGLFEMGEDGLIDVPDPSALFLGDRRKGAAGSVVVPALEGNRPLLVEIQALLGPRSPTPRRSVLGLDPTRVSFLLAVLDRAGVKVGNRDVYVSAVGGARVIEPAADLGICLAVASSLSGRPLPDGMVALGEVGLGGELRRVSQMGRRLAEASRLGFCDAVIPSSTTDGTDLSAIRADGVLEALTSTLGLTRSVRAVVTPPQDHLSPDVQVPRETPGAPAHQSLTA